MVKAQVLTLSSLFHDAAELFPPGLLLSVAAGCVEHRKYWSAYVKEFIGSMLMICFTFSAGKWVGQDDIMAAWTFHAVGVVAADYFGKTTYCVGVNVGFARWAHYDVFFSLLYCASLQVVDSK